jgi:hypothetical protein
VAFEWEPEFVEFRQEVRAFSEEWRTTRAAAVGRRSLTRGCADECLAAVAASVEAPREWV